MISSHQKRLTIILIILFCASCGGGGGGSSSPPNNNQPVNPEEKQWNSVKLNTISSVGLSQPEVRTIIDSNDNLHIVYYSSVGSREYSIFHQIWDTRTFQQASDKTSIIKIDNCQDLATGVTIENEPIIMYQGGNFPSCGYTETSDIMMKIYEDNQWKEYTVSIGEVERNPIVNDGLVGRSFDMVVDNQNQVHMCFQFFYEGCDTITLKNPDLWYVSLSPDSLDQIPEAVSVEGNDFDNGNIHNKVGYFNSIALTQNNEPMIFYQAELPDTKKGLRVAYWNNPNWEIEWIETNIEVENISAAWNDKNNYMGVAYYITINDLYGGLNHCLKYAEKINDNWQTFLIDESTYCGNYCSLTYDNNGNPLIAYNAEKSRSGYALNYLKLASRTGSIWKTETISDKYNIGHYNTIQVDNNDRIYISSFSKEKNSVYMFVYE